MSTLRLNNKTNANYSTDEVVDIAKDKKKIKADGFDRAYENFLKTLPVIVGEDRQFFNHHGIFRLNRLDCNCEAFVAKKIRWKNTGNRLRVVFCIKDEVIKIIEVYFKGNKDVEDRGRICQYCC